MERQVEESSGNREATLDLLADFATGIEAAAIELKQSIGRVLKVPIGTISEEPFLGLMWEKKQGAKLKEYEFTSKAANDSNNDYNHCFNVLKANGATINNRFHCEGWKYSYWLYSNKPGTIYRQLLKNKA
jgi:hypothetical protein